MFAIDAPTTIDPGEAALLGRALGQLKRPAEQRACLVMAGVEFNTSQLLFLVEAVFPRIMPLEFQERASGHVVMIELRHSHNS